MENIHELGYLDGTPTDVSFYFENLETSVCSGKLFLLSSYLKIIFFSNFQEDLEELAKSERMAINISNFVNLLLFIGKVLASVESRSMTVIASTLDSLLDLLSGLILWFTSYSMKKPNKYHYPIGKKRMQPVVCLSHYSLYYVFI
jgi:Cation efflux family